MYSACLDASVFTVKADGDAKTNYKEIAALHLVYTECNMTEDCRQKINARLYLSVGQHSRMFQHSGVKTTGRGWFAVSKSFHFLGKERRNQFRLMKESGNNRQRVAQIGVQKCCDVIVI